MVRLNPRKGLTMKHKKIEYRVYEWLGEECIKAIDEDVEIGILKNIGDCIIFTKGYCDTSKCVPIEVIEHIQHLADTGRISR